METNKKLTEHLKKLFEHVLAEDRNDPLATVQTHGKLLEIVALRPKTAYRRAAGLIFQ